MCGKIQNLKSVFAGKFAHALFYMFFGAAILLSAPVYAQEDENWGDLGTEGMRESMTTGMFTPGRHAFDRYASSSWALEEGATSGWIERYWASAQYLIGADLDADIPEGVTLRFSYDCNGLWVPLKGSVIAGPARGALNVRFPVDTPRTSRILISIDGDGADAFRLWNVEWKSNDTGKPFGKILPESWTFNLKENICLKPSRLWDGELMNPWHESFWGFPFSGYWGYPENPAEIIWQLDGTYEIETIKAYFMQSWQCVAFEFWDGEAWSDAVTIRGRWEHGWQRGRLVKPVSTDKIRITFPDGWDRSRHIGQVELWGEGFGKPTAVPLASSPVTAKGNVHLTIGGVGTKDHVVEVSLNRPESGALKGKLNGVPFNVPSFAVRGTERLFCVELPNEAMREDCQFLELDSCGVVNGAVLDVKKDRGEIELGSYWSDGFLETTSSDGVVPAKEFSWNLGFVHELERIRIFANNAIGLVIFADNRHRKTEIHPAFDEVAGCWVADLEGIQAERISIRSDADFIASEVELFGSPLADRHSPFGAVRIETDSETVDESTDGDTDLGWSDDSDYRGKSMFDSAIADFCIHGKEDNGLIKLDQGGDLARINADVMMLTGSVKNRNLRLFVNDAEIPLDRNSFSAEIRLDEGFQFLTITAWDRRKRMVLDAFRKPVYRTVGAPVIAYGQPYGDHYTQRDAIEATGYAGNGVALSLAADGKGCGLLKDAFRLKLDLAEGLRVIEFLLSDTEGRTAKRTMTVIRDRTAPEISILHPAEGQYLGAKTVEFRIGSKTGERLWWKFNREEWEIGPDEIKTKSYVLADGFYSWTIRAQDRSGNISEPANVSFCVDATPPEEFTLLANVSGWTNNANPTISFVTSDTMSGVDRYECSIDSSSWCVAASPYILPTLADGLHAVDVRAVDRAGNMTSSRIEVKIDTSNPPAPEGVRTVPGADIISLKWEGKDDGEDCRSYRIERNPAWDDGVREVVGLPHGNKEYVDRNLRLKDAYSYRLWSVDRAGNESGKSEWIHAQTGFQSVPIEKKGDTLVEYGGASLLVPEGATAADIVRIQINEVPLDSIVNQPKNLLASKLYQISTVRTRNGETYDTLHADLLKPVSVEISYDESVLSDGYTASDLKPFYYDDLWGEWVPAANAAVDTSKHTIRFETNHLTDFTVQATKAVDLSPQEIRSVRFSPFASSIGHGEISVSSETGTVSTSFTELVLPGKNGLDLVLKRTWDTGNAQTDAGERREPEAKEIDGDVPWKIADGWRMNFPSMKWNSGGLWMTDLDGNTLSLTQLSSADSEVSGDYVTVKMVNDERFHLEAEVVFKRTLQYTYFLYIKTNEYYSYKFNGARVFMKDGREVSFDSKGRVMAIRDAQRINVISFAYDNRINRIQKITDSMGRVLSFDYAATGNGNYIGANDPVGTIRSVNIERGGSRYENPITYTLDGTKLATALDVGGRQWNYSYSTVSLANKSVLKDPPAGYVQTPEKKTDVNVLSAVSGPGIGKTKIEYTTKSLEYDSTVTGSDDRKYTYTITNTRLLATCKSVFLADEASPQRKNVYEINLTYGEHSQFYTSSSVVNDGRIRSTTAYDKREMTRKQLSQAPEAIRKTAGFAVGDRDDTVELATSVMSVSRVAFSGNTVSTETNAWDDKLRLTSRTTAKSETNSKVQTYAYDGWGNVIGESSVLAIGSRIEKILTDRVFYTPGMIADTVVQGIDIPSSVGRPSVPSLSFGQKSLVASVKTRIFGWYDDAANANTPDTEVTEFEAYDYSALGQCARKIKKIDSSSWAVTDYAYDPVTGQVSSSTAPAHDDAGSRQVTSYAYDYPAAGSEYIVTSTSRGVNTGFGTAVDIVRKQTYNALTGTLTKVTDGEGRETNYSYDWLGRVTKEIKPSLTASRPKITVEYNDNTLTTVVSNELGGITMYSFDRLGRLTSTSKNSSILSPLSKKGAETESISTALVYNGYDEVVKMIGPCSNLETDPRRTPGSLVTEFEYDMQGRIVQTKLPGSENWRYFSYDDNKNETTSRDELSNVTKSVTDWDGNVLVTETFLGGNVLRTRAFYDGAGRVIAKFDANNQRTTITYNDGGLETEVASPFREIVEDGVKVTNAAPLTLKEYYPSGSVKKVSTGYHDGTMTTIASHTDNIVNGLGWIIQSRTPVSDSTTSRTIAVSVQYDRNGNKLAEKSGYSGGVMKGKSWTYDAQGNILSETDELGAVTSYAYDAAGNRTRVIDPRQSPDYAGYFTLSLSYDQFGRLINAILPKDERTSSTAAPEVKLAYDGRGNLVKREEADDVTLSYAYSLRNLLESESMIGNTTSGGATAYITTHAYDKAGRETLVTAPSGLTTQNEYDGAGRLTREGNETDGWIRYDYDPNGNVVSVTDRRGHKTEYKRNPEGLVLKTTDALGGETFMNYDHSGRLAETVDAEKNRREYRYDEIGRLVAETTATGSTVSYVYDGWGNAVSFIDARGTTFTHTYTRTNHLETETATNGTTTENLVYTYDEAGDIKTANNGFLTEYNVIAGSYQPSPYGLTKQRSTVIDDSRISMGYSYDNRQRLTGVSMPDGSEVTYGYNSIGELSTMAGWVDTPIAHDDAGCVSGYTMNNGIEASFSHDNLDRLLSISYADDLEHVRNYVFTYDNASNIVTKTVNGNSNVYIYDKVNRLVAASETGLFQKQPGDIEPDYGESSRDYSGMENNIKFTSENSKITLDADSKSVTCDLKKTVGINRLELFSETKNHRVKPEQISIYVKADPSAMKWEKIDRWTSAVNPEDGSINVYFPQIITARYLKVSTIWDDRDRDNKSVLTYAMFEASARELIQIWTLEESHKESYDYDKISNRMSLNADGNSDEYEYEYYKNSAGGNLPLIKFDGAWYYTYDKAGNRIMKGRALLENADNTSIDMSREYWVYEWDLHNRLLKVEQKGIVQSVSNVSVSYAYDSENHRVMRKGKDGTTVYSYGRSGALTYQKNITSGFERTYAYLGDKLVGWTDSTGAEKKQYYALTDNLGSVTEVSDATGETVWKSEYLPFGVLSGAEGPMLFNGMYTGKDIDPETGLTYHWNRWRSEDGSTFISEDPARDGVNWYGYCGANPMNAIDPSGLFWKEIGVVIKTAFSGDGAENDTNDDSTPVVTIPEPEDPETYTDPFGVDKNAIFTYNRKDETITVEVWDDNKPNRPIIKKTYTNSTNNVVSDMITYDPDDNAETDNSYNYYPQKFPDSPEEGWLVTRTYESSKANQGPTISMNTKQVVTTYDEAGNPNGTVVDTGYADHGGTGTKTWGCIKSSDENVRDRIKIIEDVKASGGESRYYTISGDDNGCSY